MSNSRSPNRAGRNQAIALASTALGLLAVASLAACGPGQRERDLATANEALRTQVSTVESRAAELTRLLAQERESNDELSAQLSMLQAERAGLRLEVDGALTELSDTDEQMQELRASFEAAARQRDQAVAQAQALAREHEEALSRSRELAQELGQAQLGRQEAATRLEQALTELEQVSAQLDAALADVLRTRAEADAANAAHQAALAELSAVRAELERAGAEKDTGPAEQLVATLHDQLAASRSQLSASKEELVRVEARLEAATGERDAAMARLQELGARSASLDEELGVARGELLSVQERAGLLTVRLGELLQRESGLRQTTQAQRNELAEVRTALEAAQNDVARLTGARGIYTVQPGDSLSSIAAFFYRSGGRWPDILQANRHLVEDPDLIFAGMVLIIPN
jgi:nucleoid-associated protein YgaU